ncbi:hypothetical protein [Streptomyces sp. NPDC058240]|uniref:hypothetical protein n=1 Tax=Streptomyces sp. NPDC058240 TaxID=3346396 RepID=UPI0036EF49E4
MDQGDYAPSYHAQLAMAALEGIPPEAIHAHGWPGWLLLALPDHTLFTLPWTTTGAVQALEIKGGRFRQVQTRTLRFKTGEPGIECFTSEQIQVMVQLARNARDRFMIVLMRATGMRIGETLGMRREDVHLLADSRTLGCHVRGPHVHVHRRRDNFSGWRACRRKSAPSWQKQPRSCVVCGQAKAASCCPSP